MSEQHNHKRVSLPFFGAVIERIVADEEKNLGPPEE